MASHNCHPLTTGTICFHSHSATSHHPPPPEPPLINHSHSHLLYPTFQQPQHNFCNSLPLQQPQHFYNPLPPQSQSSNQLFCEVCHVRCDTKDVLDKHTSGKKHIKNMVKLQGTSAPSLICQVCNIRCDTMDVLNLHNMGRKHQKNLKKFSTASAPVALAWSEKASGSHGDLQSKMKKVVDGGAAVSAVKTCETCNVVCNSDTVYQQHLQGQKHAAMLKKI